MTGRHHPYLDEAAWRLLGGPGSGNPSQPRDSRGEWTSTGGSQESKEKSEAQTVLQKLSALGKVPAAINYLFYQGGAHRQHRKNEYVAYLCVSAGVIAPEWKKSGKMPVFPTWAESVDSSAFAPKIDIIRSVAAAHPDWARENPRWLINLVKQQFFAGTGQKTGANKPPT